MSGLAFPKPAKGAFRGELLAQRQKRRAAEERAKAIVRARDQRQCRVPGCRFQKEGWALHVAHLEDKGMGGDKRLDRTQAQKLICLCFQHHEGPLSLHSKDLRIEPETARGTDGPCLFWISDEQQKWTSLGSG